MSSVDWLAEMEIDDAMFLFGGEGFCIDSNSHNAFSSSSLELQVPPLPSETPTQRSVPVATNYVNRKSTPKANKACKRGDTKEHVIAERKRRAKLSQQFIALTAIVPGIKKMDKSTVLDDTIKYMKHLQQTVQKHEEHTKKTMESAVVKKFQVYSDRGFSSSDENFSDEPHVLPEIEVRVSDRNVLIRIHCEKRKGLLVKTLEELEKLNLSVVNSSAIPYGDSSLDITLMAQMDDGFTVTVKDLVRSLRTSLIRFMGEKLSRR